MLWRGDSRLDDGLDKGIGLVNFILGICPDKAVKGLVLVMVDSDTCPASASAFLDGPFPADGYGGV